MAGKQGPGRSSKKPSSASARRSAPRKGQASGPATPRDEGADASPAAGFSFNIGGAGSQDAPGGFRIGGESGGLLGGLSGLLRTLGELAEKGAQLQREGTFTTPDGKQGAVHYGFTIRSADRGGSMKVEPFGNVRADRRTGEVKVQEVREPMTDVFEEKDHVKVVLEMPGVDAKDVKAEVDGDILTVQAVRGEKRYRKELLLPGNGDYQSKGLAIACHSGVVEVRVPRAA